MRKILLTAAVAATIIDPVLANTSHDLTDLNTSKNSRSKNIKFGANLDLFATSRNFGAENNKAELKIREVELSLEAQINPWLYGVVFLTKPAGEPFDVEEAAVIANLSYGFRFKAGKYRNEFGLLNTIHEPERPQISLPLPITEFLGEEQLRELGVTIGKTIDFGNGHRGGASLALLNNENEIAFNKSQSKDKAYSGKLYYGYKSSATAYQLGCSVLTGKNNTAGTLNTNLQVFDFSYFLQPDYASKYDYSARFMLLGEVFYNQREITSSNLSRARGYWAVADYQFMPAHHVGLGLESTEGRLDQTIKSKACSIHYSWYYSSHGRLQLEARRLSVDNGNDGLEILLQLNIVLEPHREKPFLAIMD
ncbi:hypothetical protein MNBD_GAMMA23-682 [hydrothermal vent metagenome]|uniref:Phosphate-selective porin O and P n=1 Tax=hydrothermal vent metagenome TaxID=652676 RepID=A0A3B1A0R5_9ZZZZ